MVGNKFIVSQSS